MSTTTASLYSTDTKPNALPAIRFPGEFVTLQGLTGDGVANTLEEPHDLPSAIERRGLHVAPREVHQASRYVQACFDRWRQHNRQSAVHEWNAWAQDAARTPRLSGINNFYQVIIHQEGKKRWWVDEKTTYLASFSSIPDLSKNAFHQNGWLAPGTHIEGLELYNVTNPTIQGEEETSRRNQTRKLLPNEPRGTTGKNRICPWNRLNRAGEILMMSYKVSPREGYDGPQRGFCVYSIDGYPFVQPGSLRDYAENYANHECWYWKVTRARGITVGADVVPYGALVEVHGRKRYQDFWSYNIVAFVYNEPQPRGYKRIEGILNEPIDSTAILPLPFAVPVLYEVVIPGGAKIWDGRTGECRFYAREDGILTVTRRELFDGRVNANCMERLYVAGCGWISTKRRWGHWKGKTVLVSAVIDQNFLPRKPEAFHYSYVRTYLLKEQAENIPPGEGEGNFPSFRLDSDIVEESSDSAQGAPSDETDSSHDDDPKSVEAPPRDGTLAVSSHNNEAKSADVPAGNATLAVSTMSTDENDSDV